MKENQELNLAMERETGHQVQRNLLGVAKAWSLQKDKCNEL